MLPFAKFGWVCVKLDVWTFFFFFCPTLIITCLHRKLCYHHSFNELNFLILTELPLPVIHSLHFYTLHLCNLVLFFFFFCQADLRGQTLCLFFYFLFSLASQNIVINITLEKGFFQSHQFVRIAVKVKHFLSHPFWLFSLHLLDFTRKMPSNRQTWHRASLHGHQK